MCHMRFVTSGFASTHPQRSPLNPNAFVRLLVTRKCSPKWIAGCGRFSYIASR